FAFIMGDMLNMYSNARADNAEWILREKERMKTGETQMLNPVDLFEINDYISITELDKVLTQHGTVPRGKFLLETLAVLSPAERNKKINEYNQQV
ncbi:hypothetical protein, partial [Enterococcus faecium]|uniref:hypothetical protein n=1 Tax=Enterococcus faecium TaxID=1352 RepID=UPI0034E94289